MITVEQVLEASSRLLLEPGAVTDGWQTERVDLVDGRLLIVFTWQQLPYRFAVRVDLDDLSEGLWTGMPVGAADEWVHELSGMLMEEFDTGAAAGLPRVVRGDLVELLLDEPRVGQLPPEMTAEYDVSTRALESDWFMRENGLDPGPALDAAGRRQLRAWWSVSVNNAQGLPVVAQLVVTGSGQEANLDFLQVRDDLPEAVPVPVIAQMLYAAVWSAACDGARLVTCAAEHPALALSGLQRDGDQWLWRADGPVLTPPDLVQPLRFDAERAALLAQYRDEDTPGAEDRREQPPDVSGWEAIGAAQAELQDDVGRLIAYGQQHPLSWGGLRFDGTRLAVAFTEPELHRAAVGDLVQHPDRVDLATTKRSEQERQRIRAQVVEVLRAQPGLQGSAGMTGEHVNVDLAAAGLPVAERLWAEHGDALRITVAGHRYPLDQAEVEAQPLHPGTQQTAPRPDGLVVDLDLDAEPARSGGYVRGHLVLRATTAPVRFESDQPLYGELLDAQGRRVNDLSGFRVGTGWSWNLAPGESGRVPFSAGTDSARLADGPYVPAGTWSLIVPIPVHDVDGGGPGRTKEIVAGPFSLILAEPP